MKEGKEKGKGKVIEEEGIKTRRESKYKKRKNDREGNTRKKENERKEKGKMK